ncbi:MAG TPA: PepSY-associated TM helix domain-containing protein [Vicinamibacterales bacterium]|nr:PepSY-associated TM helix domain-containing protein [Vicinamibacterales bacterium]
MRSLALRGRLRRWLTRLHRWAGLLIMACMLVAATTGTWLVFRIEMDRLVNPHLRVVRPGTSRVSMASIVEAAEHRFPGAVAQALTLQERPEDSIGVYLQSRDPAAADFDQLFFNPYDGAFLGGRSTSRLVFTREHLDPLIDRLHYSLWMNSWGLWLMGIVAGVWLITSIVGLALAWPRPWLHIAGWLPILSTRVDRGPYQANYQFHRAAGVWFLPVLIVLAFTSLYQNLPQFVRPIVHAFSPLAERPPGRPLQDGATTISPDRAIDELRERFPAARPSSLGIDRFGSRYSVLFHLPGDLSPEGENWAFVDMVTGEIAGLKLTATSSAGDRLLTWIFPLHTGTAFGMPGRIVIALAGVALVGMLVTGFYVWGVKWRMRLGR